MSENKDITEFVYITSGSTQKKEEVYRLVAKKMHTMTGYTFNVRSSRMVVHLEVQKDLTLEQLWYVRGYAMCLIDSIQNLL